MNSGLPSLLDAIFGKTDLSSVSLDEMYEVVQEFPSFNAAHFFLSKKLKEQNNEAYENESRRTALYFNNAFWLQTLLDEKNNMDGGEISPAVEKDRAEEFLSQRNVQDEPVFQISEVFVTIEEPAPTFTEPVQVTDEPVVSYEETVPSFFEREPPIDQEVQAVAEPEEKFTDPVPMADEFQNRESVPGPVTSFDELISKYHIEGIEPAYQTAEDLPAEQAPEVAAELPADPVHEAFDNLTVESEEEPKTETIVLLPDIPIDEYDSDFVPRPEGRIRETFPHSESDQFETREEVVNEYGIFEEVRVKKSDLDWESFDRPIENSSPAHDVIPAEIPTPENENIVEHQSLEESNEKSDEQDYDSFDRPLDDYDQDDQTEDLLAASEILTQSIISETDSAGPLDADDTDFVQTNETEKIVWHTTSPENEVEDPSQQAFKRFEEEKKSVAPFDTKKAESIVFAPYHMIDYFASQGIKLVLEDNPPDNLGKQLKSFTDWLKVMKRLPVQPASERTDEKEADRIRHFAAHSIEERDILTESMAEVLAKQGMYENAIALYQKLSLIYPPKSAYFASRIEQLKASLP